MKKQTVQKALCLEDKLQRQKRARELFGKYRWRGDLARSRRARTFLPRGAGKGDHP